MKRLILICLLTSMYCFTLTAQSSDRWQQAADYTMEIDVDVKNNTYTGKQKIVYSNNSPDQLNRVFYHLYYNAFQPGSMMDVRSLTIDDPDRRVGDRISKLQKDEIGFIKVKSLTQDGQPVNFEHVGTILEVDLKNPINSGKKCVLEMEWEAQIPLQIRRTGRDNKEGISLSMTQWYPKLSEYDYMGWHANPYIGREFHGVWGDFDVKISIDETYILGGTGDLQNANEIGYGYEKKGSTVNRKPKDGKLTWHFVAKKVHDFAWAGDPDYKHTKAKVPNGPMLHFLYQENPKTKEVWAKLPEFTVKAFQKVEELYGDYPYNQYSVIQGGDGGMEYPMATLITGHRNLGSLVGVTVHEVMHTWYQMLMGTNEALYAWMDEGFTSYASNIINAYLFEREGNPHESSYGQYIYLATQPGIEEPLSTHADHFKVNMAYGIASYGKGAVFPHQLSYIIGKETFDKGMLAYYDTWRFRHPNPNDYIRVMEKLSGLELDWYKEYFVYTTKTIDYGVKSVAKAKKGTKITLERVGDFIMPIDLEVEYTDGTREIFNIPLQIMRGAKAQEDMDAKYTVAKDWAWVNPTYELLIPQKIKKIKRVTIDPTKRLADVDPENNEKTEF